MKEKITFWLNQICDALNKLVTAQSVSYQSDWNNNDETSGAFIKNKPDVPVRYEVEDITAIDGDILTALKCGDIVVKITGVQKHTYIVSYKGEGVGEGICLSYNAAGYGETVAYDLTESGWAYNSTDIKTYGD